MGQVCYRRDVNQTIKTTQKFHPMKRSDALNLFISQQVQSVKSVKGIENEYQKIKDSSDPNMILQHQLYQAKEQNNIQFILEHMTDDTSINNFQDFDHAWAEKPKSIGSVAMMFMGFMIMRELSPEELGYQYQEQVIDNNIRAIVQFGIFGKLKNNLKHRVSFKFQSLDRVQITVLFLVFFIEFQEFHQLLLDENFFQVIIPYVYINTKYPMGFRIAAGFILRDLFKNRRDLIKILLQDLNYTNSIKNFLKNSSQQFVFEGLNTLEDLIYDSESSNFTHVETCKTLNNLEFFENLQYIQLQLMYPQNNTDSFQENDSINEERQVILEIVKHLMIQILQHNI